MTNNVIILMSIFCLTACGHLRRAPEEQPLHYQCGTLPLTVTQREQPAEVKFILDGKQLTLARVMSASGVRYSDGYYTFWSKGANAFIERKGKIIINDCILAG